MDTQMAHETAVREVAERTRASIEAGVIPWRVCWSRIGGLPRNYITGKPYRGANLFLLAGAGFTCPWWICPRQAQKGGGRVRDGEQATTLYYWNLKNPKRPKAWPFGVFNLEQIHGLKTMGRQIHGHPTRLEKLLDKMPNPPRIVHGMDFTTSGYWPQRDIITMPLPRLFPPNSRHIHELFRQLTHATGRPERLNRYTLKRFDPDPYFVEGLCGEMGASILSAETGVQIPELVDQRKSRGAWSLALQGNPSWYCLAADQAQRAVDYALGRTRARGQVLTAQPKADTKGGIIAPGLGATG